MPIWTHWALVVVLSIFGILTLFSIPEVVTPVLLGIASIFIFAQVAAVWSLKFKERKKLKKEEGKVESASLLITT